MAARLRIGLVFEGGGRLFNQLSVAENVALPLRYHRSQPGVEAGERVKAILDATGLTPWAESTGGRINLARRQRVALARSLAMSPEALLLDSDGERQVLELDGLLDQCMGADQDVYLPGLHGLEDRLPLRLGDAAYQ